MMIKDKMMNRRSNYFAFSCGNSDYFLYDVNKDAIVSISRELFLALTDNSGVEQKASSKELDILINKGYLSDNRTEIIEHPASNILEELLSRKVGRVCLQITQNCNFRCEYCVYSGGYFDRVHTNKKMSWETAKKSIDFMLAHSTDSDIVDVSFYGGEPLLELDLISKCINYTIEKAEGKITSFHLTTNGSLLTDEIVELFLRSNAKISISLDGPKEIQDKNRKTIDGSGTFDLVFGNIKDKLNKYPNLYNIVGFNMVIDPRIDIDPIFDFLEQEKELFSKTSLSASIIVDDWRKEPLVYSEEFSEKWKYGEFRYMLFLLNRITENNSDIKVFAGEFFKLVEFARETRREKGLLRREDHHAGPCVPGQLRLFVDADGYFFPCERVSESTNDMIIGNIDTGFDMEKVDKLLNIGKLTEDECKECFAFRHCIICATMADDGGKISREKKLYACQISKSTFECMLKDLCALKLCGLTMDNIELR